MHLGTEYHAACHEKIGAAALAGFEATAAADSMLGVMKQVEFYRWLLPPDAWNKKPHLSRWKMSREEAEKRYPGATPDERTREVRDCPEDNGEALRTTLSGGTSERA